MSMLNIAENNIADLTMSIDNTGSKIASLKDELKVQEKRLAALQDEIQEWQEVRTIFEAKKATGKS